MLTQVVALFVEEYDFEEVTFKSEFDLLINHRFQKGKAVGLAAVDGSEVLGFTSYTYWPLQGINGSVLNTYQCGNVVVGRRFRGRGVFSGLLKAIQKGVDGFQYDFIIGFPVEQSYHGFVKYGWESPFKLKWLTKLSNPIRALCSIGNVGSRVDFGLSESAVDCSRYKGFEGGFSADFQDYRSAIRKGCYLSDKINRGEEEIYFEIKYAIRKRFLVEGIIGRVVKRSGVALDQSDIEAVLEISNRHMRVSFFSFAFVEGSNIESFLNAGFSELKSKQIHFIHLNGDRSFTEDLGVPNFGRADIDTW